MIHDVSSYVYLCVCVCVCVYVCNNILVISCRSVLLEVEIGVPGKYHRPAASH
jgi:hypothetical protein